MMKMYLRKEISRKTFKKYFFVGDLKVINENSRIRTVAISQRHGSADPNPYENGTDLQH
jgi:hypothetical protein